MKRRIFLSSKTEMDIEIEEIVSNQRDMISLFLVSGVIPPFK